MGQYRGGDGEPEERRDSGTRRVATQSLGPLIVFADDSAVQTLKMRELLEGAGYRAVPAVEGRAALRRVKELRPDLVILDLEMPGMGGAEACREIKKDKDVAHIPVLIITAHDDPKYLVAAFEAGCTGYLLKGSGDAVLLEKVARHLPAGRRVRQAK